MKNNSKNLFIVIEGIDGSGKTTLSKTLAQQIESVYYKTPASPFSELRSYVDNINNTQARFFFYFTNILYASLEIQELLKNKSVICDRYYYSTFAYHYALNPKLKKLGFEKLVDGLIEPDLVFYLHADFETRITRICRRENIDVKNVLKDSLNNKIFTDTVDKEFLSFQQLIKINSQENTIEQLIDIVKQEIIVK